MENTIEFEDMTYIASVFENNLHLMHLYASGDNFDCVHSLCKEYYEKAADEKDYFAEKAITGGVTIDNFSNSKEFVDKAFTVIQPKDFDIKAFAKEFKKEGTDYLNFLKSIKTDNTGIQSTIDSYIDYWTTEVEYKNEKRLG
jgi:DNA-binding ferritin-like protein